MLIVLTMGGIEQNLQLQSDGSEIVRAIRAPHKTYTYQIMGKNECDGHYKSGFNMKTKHFKFKIQFCIKYLTHGLNVYFAEKKVYYAEII